MKDTEELRNVYENFLALRTNPRGREFRVLPPLRGNSRKEREDGDGIRLSDLRRQVDLLSGEEFILTVDWKGGEDNGGLC